MNKYVTLNYVFILVLCLDSSNVFANEINEREVLNEEMEGKIVGGEPIPLERVPYSVQLFNSGAMCAGTILNSWVIITAAHCFDLNIHLEDIVVQVESRFVYDFNAIQHELAEVLVHPKYNQSGLFACDIALVFLETRIEFNKKVKKAVLASSKKWMTPKEQGFIVTGWGWTEYGGPVSKLGLMMASLQFVSNAKCSQLHKITISDDMFCLYGGGSRDTCKGDSGGGVFWKDMLVGITSHGDGCAKKDKPSVYTNVVYFEGWIKKNVLNYIQKYCSRHEILRSRNNNTELE